MRRTQTLLGRTDVLAALRRAAGPVALVGPGGIGKTTLARALLEEHGGTWVDAAGARDVRSLLSATAGALGVGLDGPDPAEQIARALAREARWVALDNLEQVQGVQGLLEGWSGRVERLILTSRFPLPAATTVVVEPLGDADARALFALRADEAAPGRTHAPDEVARLLELLGGVPLAIELAAGHTGLESAGQIAERVAAGKGVGDLSGLRPGRQRDLAAVVRTSVSLLEPTDRDVLERVAVFAGAFELEDAEAVLGSEAVVALDRLRRRFLVQARSGEPGTELLLAPEVRATLRTDAPIPASLGRAHAEWAAEVADRQSRALRERFDPVAAARLERVAGDLIEALDRVEPGLLAARITGALCDGRLAARRSPQQHLVLLDKALVGSTWAPERAPLVRLRAGVLRQLGRQHEGREQIEAELERAGRAGDAAGQARLRSALANALIRGGGSRVRATELARQAAGGLKGGDPEAEARALRTLGLCLRVTGEVAEAADVYRASLVVSTRLSDRRAEVIARSQLAFLEDDPQTAMASARGAIEVAEQLGDPRILLAAHSNAAHALADIVPWDQVRPLLERALEYLEAQGMQADRLRARARVAMAETLAVERAADLEDRLAELLDEARRQQANEVEPWLYDAMGVVAHLDGRLDVAAERYGAALERARALHQGTAADAAGVLSVILAVERGQADLDPLLAPIREEEREWVDAWLAAVRDPAATVAALEHPRLVRRWYLKVGQRVSRAGWKVAEDGTWFSRGSKRVSLGRRRAPKRLLAELARVRVDEPGRAIDAEALFAVGWPDQKVYPDSAMNRLYVAINDLRSLGLEGVLQSHLGGYRLDPDAPVERVPPNSKEL